VDPAYAVAVDRAAQLRGEAAQVEKSIRHYEAVLRRDQEQGDRRWREMGFLRQVMHKSGARPDPWMRHHERGERHAIEELDKLDPRRVALAPQLPAAEKEMAAAFTRAEPAAAAELATREERAGLAREILEERRQQEQARERRQERSHDRDYGMER
jgi:hypothetical protein